MMKTYPWYFPDQVPERGRTFFAIWKVTDCRIGGKSWLHGDSDLIAVESRSFGISADKLWADYRDGEPGSVLLGWKYEDEFELEMSFQKLGQAVIAAAFGEDYCTNLTTGNYEIPN